MKDDTKFGFVTPNPEDTAGWYSSPNTNTAGWVNPRLFCLKLLRLPVKVYKTQIINDREFIFANQCSHGRNGERRIDRFKEIN
jgi:hypothetical protein